jgi:F-type H+-transporting ATPase subunit delta
MSVAEEQRAVDTVADDFALINNALQHSRPLTLMLASPVVREPQKIAVVREVFRKRISALTLSFLELLITKHREIHLREMIAQYHDLHNEVRGIVTVDVYSAVDLEKRQEKALTAELARRTGKKVQIRLVKDPAIMGGLVVRIGDTVLDASVRHQLAKLRERFSGAGRFASN